MKTMDTKPNLQSDCNLSDVEIKMILALLSGQGGNFNLLVSSSKLAYLLGGKGKWSAYRHKAMEAMAARGIIVYCKLTSGKKRTWHYGFHAHANIHLSQMLAEVK
jgi:hypothetical protein